LYLKKCYFHFYLSKKKKPKRYLNVIPDISKPLKLCKYIIDYANKERN